jgi:RimJ/RimL family protein N-acetyltransferase
MEKRAFPEKIEAQRLLLRRYTNTDATSIAELVNENREQLIREFAQLARLREIEEAKSFIEEKGKQWEAGKAYCYGIWRLDGSGQVGQIQVKNITWDIPAAELSYFIDKRQQRQGYASESIAAVLEKMFLEMEFERIFVRILPVNLESHGLAKKLGFKEEGLHRRAFRCGFGKLHDVRYLAMTADEYRDAMGLIA